jgi:hypothetical protein
MLISGFEGIDLHFTRKPSNEPMRNPSDTSNLGQISYAPAIHHNFNKSKMGKDSDVDSLQATIDFRDQMRLRVT